MIRSLTLATALTIGAVDRRTRGLRGAPPRGSGAHPPGALSVAASAGSVTRQTSGYRS